MQSNTWANLVLEEDVEPDTSREQAKKLLSPFWHPEQWEAQGRGPVIRTHYKSSVAWLYLPLDGPTARQVNHWLELGTGVEPDFSNLPHPQTFAFSKARYRVKLLRGLAAVGESVETISTGYGGPKGERCNRKCLDAEGSECTCRCDHRYHGHGGVSGSWMSVGEHGTLVRTAEDVTDWYYYNGKGDPMPELPEHARLYVTVGDDLPNGLEGALASTEGRAQLDRYLAMLNQSRRDSFVTAVKSVKGING